MGVELLACVAESALFYSLFVSVAYSKDVSCIGQLGAAHVGNRSYDTVHGCPYSFDTKKVETMRNTCLSICPVHAPPPVPCPITVISFTFNSQAITLCCGLPYPCLCTLLKSLYHISQASTLAPTPILTLHPLRMGGM